MTDTSAAVALPDLEETEARELTARIAENVEGLWQLIGEAYSRKAWSALGYTSWEAYTETEFGMSRGQAYRLVDQARTVAALEEAAGLEPGELGVDVVSARAAADLKPVLDEVTEQVAEQTKGRRRASRPEIVRDVVSEARQTQTAAKNGTGSSTPAPAAPAAAKPPTGLAALKALSVDAVLGALLQHPPVDARELSNNRWAKVRSWIKQAEAVRNPIDATATETTKPSTSSKRGSSGKASQSASKGECKHPSNRRLGDHCMECDTDVK